MAKVKWKQTIEKPDDVSAFPEYDAEGLPPLRPYRWRIVKVELVENASGDDMFKVHMTIDEPEGTEKSKYNNYFTTTNLNFTDKGKKFLMGWLQSIGVKWSDLIDDCITDDDGRPTTVKRIGPANFIKGVYCRASTKPDVYQGEKRVVVKFFIPQKPTEKPAEEAQAVTVPEDYDPETDGSLEEPPF